MNRPMTTRYRHYRADVDEYDEQTTHALTVSGSAHTLCGVRIGNDPRPQPKWFWRAVAPSDNRFDVDCKRCLKIINRK